jgi:ATP-dependent Lon protease
MDYLTIPLIKINGRGLFPGMRTELLLRRSPETEEIIRSFKKRENEFAVFFAKNTLSEKSVVLPKEYEVYTYGVLVRLIKISGGEGERLLRFDIDVVDRLELLSEGNGIYANVHVISPSNVLEGSAELEAAYKESLRDSYFEYNRLRAETEKRPGIMPPPVETLNIAYPLAVLLGHVMGVIEYDAEDAQSFLATDDLEGRFFICMDKLKEASEVKRLKADIAAKVRDGLSEKQKQAVLNEEMNVIRKQMNDGNEPADEYREKLKTLDAPEAVKEKLEKEIGRLERTPMGGAEAGVLANYIENLLEFPWNISTEDAGSIKDARSVLDEDHYGLDKVKERILEYLAVRELTGTPQGTILCLAGPPGTGKTSIVKSVARALGRKYVRISLGGVHDEAEIRGHRKTYVGAMPGRIAYAIKQAGVINPVMLLDELDKMGMDGVHGSPADAMLEVLDSEQNVTFRDHYMEVPLDLSRVIFIATANDKTHIPAALYDRLDIIDVDSYTAPEKLHIADKYLIEKQMKKNGLSAGQLCICEGVIEKMIHDYTREAGVRELERRIASICRKTALRIMENNEESIKITVENLDEFLGKPYHNSEENDHLDKKGVVHGLAWTAAGGVVLDVEAALMPGKGELILTGHMGDVMKESARIALSLVRSKTDAADVFENSNFHIHIPEGAVPKDGPSAGITLSTVIYSLVTGLKVRGNVAMTGEVTLTGRVLAIGGLREKLLAAKNAGFEKAIVPVANKRDVAELSEEIIGQMQIIYAEDIDEVFKEAVCGGEEKG